MNSLEVGGLLAVYSTKKNLKYRKMRAYKALGEYGCKEVVLWCSTKGSFLRIKHQEAGKMSTGSEDCGSRQ